MKTPRITCPECGSSQWKFSIPDHTLHWEDDRPIAGSDDPFELWFCKWGDLAPPAEQKQLSLLWAQLSAAPEEAMY